MKKYTLIGCDGIPYESGEKGALGGYKRGSSRLYGRLDCKSALSHIAKGGYVPFRVFFKDEVTAIAAGFRPCAKCMPTEYNRWKAHRDGATTSRSRRSR